MPLSPARLRILVASLLTVSFLGALDHTIVSTSLATIAGALGALEHMSWIIVGYTLASTVLLPVLGGLGDRFGPRGVFLISLAVFVLASLACGFAPSLPILVIARVVQGMSSSGLQLMSQTILAHVTTPRERPRYMAVVGAAFPIAILIGPVLGGVITDFAGWPWVFWINVPVGILAFAFAAFAVPPLRLAEPRPIDVTGAILFAGALTPLVLAVTWLTEPGQGGVAAALFVLSGAAFVAFFIVQARVAHPIVPIHLFRKRAISAGLALSAIIGIGLFSITAYLPTYFQMAYRTSATVSGIVPIATVFGMLLSNLVTGTLASRTGRYRMFPIIGTSLAASGLLTMALLPVGLPLWVPAIVMFVVGVGTGSFMSLIYSVVQGATPLRETGAITATINLVRQIGSTVAIAVVGGVIAVTVATALPAVLDFSTLTPAIVRAAPLDVQLEVAQIYHAVFAPVFAATAVAYALGIVAAVLLPKGRLSDQHSAPETTVAEAAVTPSATPPTSLAKENS